MQDVVIFICSEQMRQTEEPQQRAGQRAGQRFKWVAATRPAVTRLNVVLCACICEQHPGVDSACTQLRDSYPQNAFAVVISVSSSGLALYSSGMKTQVPWLEHVSFLNRNSSQS